MDCHVCMDENVECTKCKQCNFECCDDCLIGLYKHNKHRMDTYYTYNTYNMYYYTYYTHYTYSNEIKCPVCKKRDRFNVIVKTNWKCMKNPTLKKLNTKLRKIHNIKSN